jgi:hypothetical protein
MAGVVRDRSKAPWLVGGLLALATFVVLAGWTGVDGQTAVVPALRALVMQGSVALLWLAMALGFGRLVSPWLGVDQRPLAERRAIEAAVGVAVALALVSLVATVGGGRSVLLLGGGVAAWVLVAAGIGCLFLRRDGRAFLPLGRGNLLAVLAGPPIGLLLLAAASEPGWLWRSEFGGYDALSYHLQLPLEWLALGRIVPLEHNVYAALPSFVEAAFLHVMILAGGPDEGALAAQFLAAFLSILTALVVATLARRLLPDVGRWLGLRIVGTVAAVLLLALPWFLVVGSLAYNDGIVLLFLAAGWLVLARRSESAFDVRSGFLLGSLAGAACGAKLTAAGFVALPLALAATAVLLHAPGRSLRTRLASVALVGGTASLVALLILAPWLVRNAIATGSPVFPFATSVFGTGWWTEAQSVRFALGHAAEPSMSVVGRLWTQWFALGFGAEPSGHAPAPWTPQWSLLPWLGLAGALVLLGAPGVAGGGRRRLRAAAATVLLVLAVQIVFWGSATHLQSRFLLPTAVPLVVGACGLLVLARLIAPQRSVPALAMGVLAAAAVLPIALFAREGRIVLPDPATGAPVEHHAPALAIGGRGAFDGSDTRRAMRAATDDAARARIVATATPAFTLNHEIPADAVVLLVGDAAPFWYRRPQGTLRYATVWDRGPLHEVAARLPERPDAWAGELRNAGVRYVLLNEPMLRNWFAKGWLDPALDPDRLAAFVRSTTPVRIYANGSILVDVGGG